jgi:hypothetical protein
MVRWMRIWGPLLIGAAVLTTGIISLVDRDGYAGPLLPCEDHAFQGPVEGGICYLFDTRRPIGIDATKGSLGEASRMARFPIYLPSRLPPALAHQRPEFWVSGRQVAVRYRSGSESGLAVTYSLWQPGGDPARHYEDRRRELGFGRTTTIAGGPALMVPRHGPAPSRSSSPVSVVAVTLDRTEVVLFGRVPVTDLVAVAEGLERVG